MISLFLEAPFAVCRTFTAGWYRPSATFLTPSAVYGLLLNVARIESRLREEDERHDGSAPASLTAPGLPVAELALGVPAVEVCGRRRGEAVDERRLFPRVQSVYQQLHNYKVGKPKEDKARAEACKGNKYNIAPVRREFLSDVRAVVQVRGNEDFEDRILRGLAGELNDGRYGIPFVGDNSFLPDRLEQLTSQVPARWFERLGESSASGIRDRAARLTVSVDRADLSKTSSALFAPTENAKCTPGEAAWVKVGG